MGRFIVNTILNGQPLLMLRLHLEDEIYQAYCPKEPNGWKVD